MNLSSRGCEALSDPGVCGCWVLLGASVEVVGMANKLTYVVFGLVAVFVLLQIAGAPERKSSANPHPRRSNRAVPEQRQGSSERFFPSRAGERAGRSGLRVTQVQVCRGVEDMGPVGAGTRFPANVGSLYCFTVVEGASNPQVIYHEWQYGGGKVTSVPLSVEDESWRTWSRKAIRPAEVGAWQVKVRDGHGRLLAQTRFEVVSEGR